MEHVLHHQPEAILERLRQDLFFCESAEMDYKLPSSGHERASVACLKHHLVM